MGTAYGSPPSSPQGGSGISFLRFITFPFHLPCIHLGSQVVPALVHPHADTISASTVSLDGRVMAVGTTHGALTLWDHQSGNLQCPAAEYRVINVCVCVCVCV